MYFTGGMIPTYILVNNLGLIDSIWAMVIPSLVSSFNLILARTFIRELPSDLYEAAVIDGANEIYIFYEIVLPLSKPIIAVITLYYAVGIWNSFFTPLLYLNSPAKLPLQIYLREMVVASQLQDYQSGGSFDRGVVFATEAVKSCTLVISTIPILIFYPFLQKYFTRGVLIGAIKG
jgi:ABC-type glycerol-3-phosphate transport system permease component